MTGVFVSYVDEDKRTAIELAGGLEAVGLKTWYYERDGTVGRSYIERIVEALDASDAVLAVVSVHAFRSREMDRELVYAYQRDYPLIPALLGITHESLQASRRDWAFMFGAATSTVVQADNVAPSISSIVNGIHALAVGKDARVMRGRGGVPDDAPLAVPRQALDHLLGARLDASERGVVEKAAREGAEQLGEADLLRLLHVFGRSGTLTLAPEGLLVFDAAACMAARLVRRGPASAGLSEAMARLLAQAENRLGLTNRHQAVETFDHWRRALARDPRVVADWFGHMQTYRRFFLERLAAY